MVCFNPETDDKRVYTTANGLLSNQFNYQSGYKDKMGRIYLGSINGFITFDPSTFVENNLKNSHEIKNHAQENVNSQAEVTFV